MPFTAQELANIYNSALDFYLEKGKLTAQNIQDKPMLKAFESAAGTFSGGKGDVSIGIKTGQGGGSLAGYTHDDPVSYYNPTPAKRVNYSWKEMFMGLGFTHTELKHGGITVVENGADQSTSNKEGREQHVLAEILDEKLSAFEEDYQISKDSLIHGDGSGDAKSIAGIKAFILDSPALGATGGLNRTTNAWWRNRAATTAAQSAGTGFAPISSSSTGGGVLLTFLQNERRQLKRYASGTAMRHKCFAGSDFIAAMEAEIRANGNYSLSGYRDRRTNDGSMATEEGVPFGSWNFVYDPTLDDLGLEKRAYIIDMASIKLLYMVGEKKKRCNPARPHDRFVMYQGVSDTAVMVAKRLRTSGVYDIA